MSSTDELVDEILKIDAGEQLRNSIYMDHVYETLRKFKGKFPKLELINKFTRKLGYLKKIRNALEVQIWEGR